MTEEQKEDFKQGFEIAYQVEDFEGVIEWVFNFIEIEIESKLHQPTVISTVCVHSFVPAGHSWNTDWEACMKCGYKRERTDLSRFAYIRSANENLI